MENLTLDKIKTLLKEKETQLVLDKIREKLKEKDEKEIKENLVQKKVYSAAENSNILVSLILPTYNRGEKCITAIKDVLDQTHKNLELIVVNDGSTVEHTAILENFINSLNDRRIRYIKQPNTGMSASLNVGLRNLTGEYVTWISDDNRLEKNYIEELLLPRADFSYSNYNIISNDHKYLMENKHQGIKDLINNFRGMASFLWKKEIIQKIGDFNVSFTNSVNDYDFEIRTFLITQNIVHINKALIDFYQGIGTQSTNNHFEIRKKHKMVQDFYNIYLDNFLNNKKIIVYNSEGKEKDFFKDNDYKDYVKINTCNIEKLEYEEDILFIPISCKEMVNNLLKYNIGKENCLYMTKKSMHNEPETPPFTDKTTYKILYYKAEFINYHNSNKKFVHNILQNYGASVESTTFNFPHDNNMESYIEKELESEAESCHLFNSIDYAFFILSLSYRKISEDLIFKFLNQKKYIFLNYEVINSSNLTQIGLDNIWSIHRFFEEYSQLPIDITNVLDKYTDTDQKYEIFLEMEKARYKKFTEYFYSKADFSILCNSKNISYLYENNNATPKVLYFTPEGYSKINGYVPLHEENPQKKQKDIDILIYGNMHTTFSYRLETIDKISKFCETRNYRLLVRDNDVSGDEKDDLLERSKIVVHVPSYKNLDTVPWAKICELMSKKIFFIVEDVYGNKRDFDPFVKYTSLEDLFSKIDLFINDENLKKTVTDRCLQYIKKAYNSDIFYSQILKKEKILSDKYKTIKYLEFPSWKYLKFYQSKMLYYVNCLRKIYNYKFDKITLPKLLFGDIGSEDDFKYLNDEIFSKKYTNVLYIFDELVYSHFLSIYNMNEESKLAIKNFLESQNYIVYFSELFENSTMKTIGNAIFNLEFSLLFFKNSKKNIMCNTNNIGLLNENDIASNVTYFPPLGYSEINNVVPLISNDIKNVDILFMGSVGRWIFDYRYSKLNAISDFSSKNGYKFESYDLELFDEKKDMKLRETKIVVHIPSFANLETFPWAKTAELMAKKIFFIIESNSEMFIKGLNNIVAFYDPNIPDDLTNKLKYYLENEDERNKHIEKCYKYFKYNYNMDEFLKDL